MNHLKYTWPIVGVACALCFGACSDNNAIQTQKDESKDMRLDMSTDMRVDADMNGPTDVSEDQETMITPGTSSVVGRAVKGPFVKGAMVTVYELNEKGLREGRSVVGVTNDFGEFLVKPLGFDGWVEVEVKGNYFDELTQMPSLESKTMSVLTNTKNGKVTGNVNLFTAFTLKRIRALLATQLADTIEEAREVARADFARTFFIANYTERLSILNRNITTGIERDNIVLLWFSVSVLQSGTTQAKLDTLVDDFADDGRINNDGIEAFNAIKKEANIALYIKARDHLLAKYGDVPPLFDKDNLLAHSWLYNNCFVPVESLEEKLCVGSNQQLATELEPKTWTNFAFTAPYSGAFTLSANFASFNNFNQWKLLNDENQTLAQGDGRNTWRAVSLNLKAGSTYTFTAYSNAPEENNTVDVDIQPSSDGRKSSPKPLMYDVPYEGWVGFHSSNENSSGTSYYVYYADDGFEKDAVSIFVSDVGDEVEVSVYKGNSIDPADEIFDSADALLKTESGRQSVQVDVEPEHDVLLIKVTNKSGQTSPQNQAPGRLPYTIRVL